MGTIEEDVLVKILSRQLQLPVARIGGKRVKREILERVPAEMAEKYRCLPLFTREEAGSEVLFVGMDDPSDLAAIDELSFRIEQDVKPVLVAPTELEDALQRNYHAASRSGGSSGSSGPVAAPDRVATPTPPEPDTAPEGASSPPAGLPPLKQSTPEPDTDRLDDTDTETDPHQLPPMDTTLSGLEPPPDFGSLEEDPVLGNLGGDPVLGGDDVDDPAGMSFSPASEAPLAELAQAPFGDSDPEIGDFTSAPFGGTGPSPLGELADAPFSPTADSDPQAATATAAALEANVIMQALAQLLVEKGVIGRDEFAERIRKLAAKNAKPS
jgi:hypothetical protein